MDLNLKGKKALVTGSSRGLGFATALGLSQEGCEISINSRDPEKIRAAEHKISRQTGYKVSSFSADITQPGSPEKLVSDAAKVMNGIDILITNSGGPPSGLFENLVDQDWQYALELNFLAHMRLIRAALPFLKESTDPSVLTITSMSVKQPVPNLVLSNSVRSATVGLTKSLSLELGHFGIRFNSILPGWTETERIQELMEFRAKSNQTSIEEEIAKQAFDSPFNRLASPQEFANVAVFLVSPAASYLTGTMLVVDGGMYKATY
jgi:3-oxoacyl-[acyl-carrier protein] reductase